MRFLKYAAIAVIGAVISAAIGIKVMQYTIGGGHFSLPSSSMMPTFRPGETVIAVPAFDKAGPERGEVVLFEAKDGSGVTYIFRVVGVGGDTVGMNKGRVTLNGDVLIQERTDPFLIDGSDPNTRYACPGQANKECAIDQFIEVQPAGPRYAVLDLGETRLDTFGPITVPDGHIFVLGDNRDNAVDSRFPDRGFVPIENVTGIVKLRLIGRGATGLDLSRSLTWLE